jgi:ABC-type branched-subunit amino acid transport system substrate-binding protein
MKKWYNIVAILMTMVIIVGIIATGCAKTTPPQATGPTTINIGLPVALSGSAAPWGTVPTPYYETFIELFNNEGFQVGGKTYNFKLIQVDDQNTPEGGAAAAKQLIYTDGCKFFAGHWSWNFPAVSAVTNPAKVILITRTGNEAVPASWGGLYDPKTMPYVVFGTPSHEEFTSDCLAIVEAYPNYQRLGIMDSTQGMGAGWDNVDQTLDEAGVRYHHEWFPPGTTDFTPFITRYNEAGCDIVYVAGWVSETWFFAKQRWELSYKDMKVGCAGPFVDIGMYKSIVGADAAQGMIGQYWANWDFKKTEVDPKYIAMCQETMRMVAEKQGKPSTYTGWIGWVPAHLLILAQAMQKAGTVEDTDAIMEAIRGGTFDTTTGTWTMSGAKTFGSAVVFGCPSALSTIQGDKEEYLSEHPMEPIP